MKSTTPLLLTIIGLGFHLPLLAQAQNAPPPASSSAIAQALASNPALVSQVKAAVAADPAAAAQAVSAVSGQPSAPSPSPAPAPQGQQSQTPPKPQAPPAQKASSSPSREVNNPAMITPSFDPSVPCMTVLSSTPLLQQFYKALTEPAQADLLSALQTSKGNFTYFAPTNQAMLLGRQSDHLPSTIVSTGPAGRSVPPQSADSKRLSALLAYHIIPATVRASDFTPDRTPADTLLEDPYFSLMNKNGTPTPANVILMRNQSSLIVGHGSGTTPIIQADIQCQGGVVHIVDQPFVVPLPLSRALTKTGLTTTLAISNAANKTDRVDALASGTVVVFAFLNTAQGASGSATLFNVTYRPTPWVMYTANIRSLLNQKNATDLMIANDVNGNAGLRFGRTPQGGYTVNGVPILVPDIPVANGVIHILAHPLNPTTMGQIPDSATTVNGTTRQVGGSVPGSIESGASSDLLISTWLIGASLAMVMAMGMD